MNKLNMLKALNLMLALIVINQGLTGFFHDLLPDETFELIHKIGGIFLVVGIVLHIILNWKWIQVNYFPKQVSSR